MISLACAWVLKVSTENPHTRHNKYSHALKTHAKSKHNQPKGINVLKPMQGGTSDSQNNHANHVKPMHRLAKTKKTAYAERRSEGGQLRIRSPSVKEALTLTHSHSFATTNETIFRLGDSLVHTPPRLPIYTHIYTYIYIYIWRCRVCLVVWRALASAGRLIRRLLASGSC